MWSDLETNNLSLRFSYTRPDGGVSIVGAASKENLERVLGPLTDNDYRAHVVSRSIPKDATNLQELPEDWRSPEDRTFRNAWVQNGTDINVDMPKARDIQRDRLRSTRKPLLEALDVEMSRAYKDPALQDEIEAKRQVLRDVTNDASIDAAKTPDELKSVMPDALTKTELERSSSAASLAQA